MAKKKPAKKKPLKGATNMSMTHEQANAFMCSDGMKSAPDTEASGGVKLFQDTMNDIEKKVGSPWDVFAKAVKIYQIWSRPGWTVADIQAKINETYTLFNLAPPNPGPNMPT